jgi:hypothetical protein
MKAAIVRWAVRGRLPEFAGDDEVGETGGEWCDECQPVRPARYR